MDWFLFDKDLCHDRANYQKNDPSEAVTEVAIAGVL